MKNIKELLRQAQELIEITPSTLTMTETRSDAEKLYGALQKFVQKGEEARYLLDRNYLELINLLSTSKGESSLLKSVIKKAGAQSGKDKNKKIALYATKEGLAEKLIQDLKKGPSDILRQNFIDLAMKDVDEIEEAVKKMLTPSKVVDVSKAVGFEVVYKIKAGKKSVDTKSTVANAMAKLKPFINSMQDAK